MVADCLAAFTRGLVFNGAMLMLNRAFFSLQSNWIPTVVALGNLLLNAVLDLAFYRFGTWGIPLSTAIVNIAGTAVLLVPPPPPARAGSRVGEDVLGDVRGSSWRPPSSRGVAYGVWEPLDSALGRSLHRPARLARGPRSPPPARSTRGVPALPRARARVCSR